MLLTLDGVDTYYGRAQALRGLSLAVGRGEIVAILGANGAGKSTTLLTISGLLNRRFHAQPNACWECGPRVWLVGANGEAIAADEERVHQHFPRLRERSLQLAGSLSGGEQQMLAIGRALMSRPRLLLLDEPSLGLSPILVQEMFRIIEDINREGTAVLLVEQNVGAALEAAHRGYVMETGRIVVSGTKDELLHNDQVRRAYLGG